jgi:hypothetical protein
MARGHRSLSAPASSRAAGCKSRADGVALSVDTERSEARPGSREVQELEVRASSTRAGDLGAPLAVTSARPSACCSHEPRPGLDGCQTGSARGAPVVRAPHVLDVLTRHSRPSPAGEQKTTHAFCPEACAVMPPGRVQRSGCWAWGRIGPALQLADCVTTGFLSCGWSIPCSASPSCSRSATRPGPR